MTPYKVRERTYNYSTNIAGSVIYEYYSLAQIDEMVKFIESKKTDPSLLTEGDFSFYKHTTFPRDEFAEKFPMFRIKRKDWNYLVVERKHLIMGYAYGYKIELVDSTDNIYESSPTNPALSVIRSPNQHIIDIYNIIINKENATIVLLEDLNKIAESNNAVLDEDMFNNLDKLLNTRNEENVKIALSMMLNISYEQHSNEMSFLIFKNFYHSIKGITKNVRIKYFLDRIEADYKIARHDRISYLLNMVERGIPDELAAKITNHCLRSYTNQEKQFIVKIYDKI